MRSPLLERNRYFKLSILNIQACLVGKSHGFDGNNLDRLCMNTRESRIFYDLGGKTMTLNGKEKCSNSFLCLWTSQTSYNGRTLESDLQTQLEHFWLALAQALSQVRARTQHRP